MGSTTLVNCHVSPKRAVPHESGSKITATASGRATIPSVMETFAAGPRSLLIRSLRDRNGIISTCTLVATRSEERRVGKECGVRGARRQQEGVSAEGEEENKCQGRE